jgi:hypothetical protein
LSAAHEASLSVKVPLGEVVQGGLADELVFLQLTERA